MPTQETRFTEGDSRKQSLKKRLSQKLSVEKYERFDQCPRGSKKSKAKFGITPPTSPVSLKSFGTLNGGYSSSNASSPKHRTMSDTSDAGIDGTFKFLDGYSSALPEVFTISAGNGSTHNADTLSKRSEKSEGQGSPVAGGSFPEDKYKWTDGDSVNGTKHRKTRTRKICVSLIVTILVIILLAGVAVILAFKVFGVGDSDDTTTPDVLILNGSLDLDETWDPALDDPTSSLYITTANNFTAEMDLLYQNSEYNDSYISTEVIKFSPGSIKTEFKLHFNDRYKIKAPTESSFARQLQQDIRTRADQSALNIKKETVFIESIEQLTSTPTLSTPSSTKSTTTSSTTMSTPNTTTISTTTTTTMTPTTTAAPNTTTILTTTTALNTTTILTTTAAPNTTTTSTTTAMPNTTTTSTTTAAPNTTTTSTTTAAPNRTTILSTTAVPNTTTISSTTAAPNTTTTSTTTAVPNTTTISSTTAAPNMTTISSTTAAPNTTTTSLTTAVPNTTTTSTTTAAPNTTTTSTTTAALNMTRISSTTTAPNTTTTSATTAAPNTTTISSTTAAPDTTTTSTTTAAPNTTTITPSTSTTEARDMPPTAKAGPDISITLPENSVRLYGNGSTDDHGITQYQWQHLTLLQANLTGARTSNLYVSNMVEGAYQFQLTVTDAKGQFDRDIVLVTVRPVPTTTTMATTTEASYCIEVTFETCRSRGFVHTMFPNFFEHMNLTEAERAFRIDTQYVKNQICQEAALTYMCSLYFPKCDQETGYILFPCLSLCQEAEDTCSAFFTNPYECFVFEQTEGDCVNLVTTTPAPVTTPAPYVCEATTFPTCRSLGFVETHFPNFFGETDQISTVATFNELVDYGGGCHPNLKYFLCSLQYPYCSAGKNKPPCRRLCKEIVKACPENFQYYVDCETLPDIDCMAPADGPIVTCSSNKFLCDGGAKCISTSKVCDGHRDCNDWTDEMNCTRTCDQYQFQCKMGHCIKLYQRCDGEPQCPDNSDEIDCKCSHGQVSCPSGKCIMSEWLCDGRAECEDGWDEMNCNKNCFRNQSVCSDHSCIDYNKICDGVDDCPDGRDESECIKQENGILQLKNRRTWLPLCAQDWPEEFGDYTCHLLGEGPYYGKTDTTYNAFAFYGLPSSHQGSTFPSVLGHVVQTNCPEKKAVTVNCEPRGCGKRLLEKEKSFIVNGDAAAIGAWPWQAGLYYGGQYFCGGTLINENFVLTAAHCVEVYTADFRLLTVKLGAHNREESEVTQHVVKVEAIKSHREHVYFEKNDIALLQLASPVTYTKYIQPVCLPGPEETLPLYSECYTVGWGKTKWDGAYAETLQQLKMKLWDTQKCNSSIAWNGEVYDTFLCAGYYSGVRSICKGDSGGSLVCLDNFATWKILGVSSYVANYCNMTERPNIYTDVKKLIPWIEDNTECKFRCDNKRCLYNKDQICDRVDNCGDNSDEIKLCNRTFECDFEDKFLCGYTYKGWNVGYDNKLAQMTLIDGQAYSQSYAPQFDHTHGRYPGHFFYGKLLNFFNGELESPVFNTSGQTCLRFYYYLRGEISIGFKAQVVEYYKSGQSTTPTVKFSSRRAGDEWNMAYFDLTQGEFKVTFLAGDLLKTAIDDVKMIPGMCQDVLCDPATEFRCRSIYGDKCIQKQSQCDLAVECDNADDETGCSSATNSYICDFNNGNLCSLRQDGDDASDWWIVNASFVGQEVKDQGFVDHTTGQKSGYLFYLYTYGLQTDTHVYMRQKFKLHRYQYCLSFHYQLQTDAVFKIHLDCDNCNKTTLTAMKTFEEWTLFQVTLPTVDLLDVTYDVQGTTEMDSNYFSFIALDDIHVKPGACPAYVCPANYWKCQTQDRCLPQSHLCDREVDCIDESDEESCTCKANEFQCASGRCIPLAQECDKEVHCLDGSDEGSNCVSLNSVSCTFEHPYMCGYEFISHTDFTWKRFKGATPTPQTGPQVDHTLNNGFGYYVYTEANEGAKGDNASIVSPQFNTGAGHSLEFYFHIYSSLPNLYKPGVGDLSLILENANTGARQVMWASTMNLIDAWQRKCVDLPEGISARVIFFALRNETTTYGLDLAVDDVSLRDYSCSETPQTTTPAPTTTRASVTSAPGCETGKRMCRDGSCVDASYFCDGIGDCPDSSDEDDCPMG